MSYRRRRRRKPTGKGLSGFMNGENLGERGGELASSIAGGIASKGVDEVSKQIPAGNDEQTGEPTTVKKYVTNAISIAIGFISGLFAGNKYVREFGKGMATVAVADSVKKGYDEVMGDIDEKAVKGLGNITADPPAALPDYNQAVNADSEAIERMVNEASDLGAIEFKEDPEKDGSVDDLTFKE